MQSGSTRLVKLKDAPAKSKSSTDWAARLQVKLQPIKVQVALTELGSILQAIDEAKAMATELQPRRDLRSQDQLVSILTNDMDVLVQKITTKAKEQGVTALKISKFLINQVEDWAKELESPSKEEFAKYYAMYKLESYWGEEHVRRFFQVYGLVIKAFKDWMKRVGAETAATNTMKSVFTLGALELLKSLKDRKMSDAREQKTREEQVRKKQSAASRSAANS